MQNHSKEKTILIVSLMNAGINALLAIIKIIIGKIGYSQALIADGVHSFSDIVGDILVFIAARSSLRNPDKTFPYGHRRIETIATIIIGLILFSVAVTLFDEAILRLVRQHFEEPTLPVIIVAIISIIANEWLFHYSKKCGETINSTLLISNALHKRSDVFVSLIVLISVIGGKLGWSWLDAAGAIIIALLIVNMAVKMVWQSSQELIDRGVDETTLEAIKKVITEVSGVRSIHQLRTRLHGNAIFVDLHIIVDPLISVSEGHHIGEEVHNALFNHINNLFDVTVHIDPENDETARPSLHLPNREVLKEILVTRWENLPGFSKIKKMTLHYLEGYLYIEIFMPQCVCDATTAADLLAQYRDAISDMKNIASVNIHLMPK